MGPNGAIIHYAPSGDGTASAMNNDEIYLLDSGAQYLDGTTDITRTNHFGGKAPTAF
jgi:Xaa-Pro aminopeptidase